MTDAQQHIRSSLDRMTIVDWEINRNNLDEQDLAILWSRFASFNKIRGPRVGDYIHFADDKLRRIAHDWAEFDGGLQTAHDTIGHPGSFYLGDGYISYSGALHDQVPHDTLTLTGELRLGWVWFFHHDHRRAHNSVETVIPHRVFTCTEEAPR